MRQLSDIAWHLVAAGASLLLAVLCTWPLVLDPQGVGLGLKATGNLFATAEILGRPLAEWGAPSLPHLDFPDGVHPVVAGYPQLALARLLRLGLPSIAAVQLSVLLHAALGGYGAFRLARRLLPAGAPLAALGAGLAFQGSAQVLAVLANGQVENMGFGYLALAAEGAWVAIALGRPTGLLALALCTALAFSSSPYVVMAGLLGAVPAGLVALRRQPRRATAGLVLTLAVVAAGYLFYRPTAAGGEQDDLCPAQVEREIEPQRAFHLGQSPVSALARLPPAGPSEHVADPAWLLRPGRRGEGRPFEGAYLGWAVLLLGFLAARRRVPGARLLLASAVLPTILALGPYLVVNGWVPLAGAAPLAMPLHWLQSLPGLGVLFDKVQVPVRLVPGAALPLALAAGMGLATLAPRLRQLLFLVPVAEQLALGPVHLPWPTVDLHPRDAWLALAEQPDERAVLDTPPVGWRPASPEEPFPFGWMRWTTFGVLHHGHPVPSGACGEVQPYNDSAWDSAFREVVEELAAGRGEAGALAAAARELHARGYGWWLVYEGSGVLSPQAEARILEAARRELELVHRGDDGSWLFRLPADWLTPAGAAAWPAPQP